MEKNDDADEKEKRREKLRKDLFNDEDLICWVDPEDTNNSVFSGDDADDDEDDKDEDDKDEDVTDLFDFDDDEYPDEYPEYNPRG